MPQNKADTQEAVGKLLNGNFGRDAIHIAVAPVIANEKLLPGQDIGIIEALYPLRTPETTTKELLAAGEACIVGFRKLLKDWEGRSWRVDLAAMRENQGDIAYAIPSPGRRESGNWVLDHIPLMPGAGS